MDFCLQLQSHSRTPLSIWVSEKKHFKKRRKYTESGFKTPPMTDWASHSTHHRPLQVLWMPDNIHNHQEF